MAAAHAAAAICRPLRGLNIYWSHRFLGLTPQANHLSPLRGSNEKTDAFLREWGCLRLMLAKERWNRIPSWSLTSAMERRRRGSYLAWGVSPRDQEQEDRQAAERRQNNFSGQNS